jgi:hypothetical protein
VTRAVKHMPRTPDIDVNAADTRTRARNKQLRERFPPRAVPDRVGAWPQPHQHGRGVACTGHRDPDAPPHLHRPGGARPSRSVAAGTVRQDRTDPGLPHRQRNLRRRHRW